MVAEKRRLIREIEASLMGGPEGAGVWPVMRVNLSWGQATQAARLFNSSVMECLESRPRAHTYVERAVGGMCHLCHTQERVVWIWP